MAKRTKGLTKRGKRLAKAISVQAADGIMKYLDRLQKQNQLKDRKHG